MWRCQKRATPPRSCERCTEGSTEAGRRRRGPWARRRIRKTRPPLRSCGTTLAARRARPTCTASRTADAFPELRQSRGCTRDCARRSNPTYPNGHPRRRRTGCTTRLATSSTDVGSCTARCTRRLQTGAPVRCWLRALRPLQWDQREGGPCTGRATRAARGWPRASKGLRSFELGTEPAAAHLRTKMATLRCRQRHRLARTWWRCRLRSMPVADRCTIAMRSSSEDWQQVQWARRNCQNRALFCRCCPCERSWWQWRRTPPSASCGNSTFGSFRWCTPWRTGAGPPVCCTSTLLRRRHRRARRPRACTARSICRVRCQPPLPLRTSATWS